MIKEKPWIETINTKIWESQYLGDDKPANIMLWFIWAPWMHLGWKWHVVTLVHLRPIEGDTLAINKQFPRATHEITSFALDPAADERVSSVIQKDELIPFLCPPNFVHQIDTDSDADALSRVTSLLQKVGQGQLSVDSDYAGTWGLALRKKAVEQ